MDIVLFDTETTDLISNRLLPLEQQPRITEIYAMRVKVTDGEDDFYWEKISEVDHLINPGVKITDGSEKKTGITNEIVADKPRIEDVWQEIISVFNGADMAVAHNIDFDMTIINFESMRVDDAEFIWPHDLVCTVEATEHLSGYRLSLTDLHTTLFGVGFPKAHRAKNDVEALFSCFRELYESGLI